MGGRVLVVGGINADLLIRTERRPGPGETVLASDCVVGHGGKGANQAVAAAVAGARTAMIGAVGADGWGRDQLAGLRRFGVDVTSVKVLADAPTGMAAIAITPDGENSILVVPGANHAVEPGALFEVVSTADVSVVVGQCELTSTAIDEAARFARAAEARLIISAAPVIALAAETYAAADPLVVNEHEARDVVRSYQQNPEGSDSLDLAQRVRQLTACGSVVVTLGAQGAAIATSDGTRLMPGEPVEPVDTTGAGDTFAGTLAACLARGERLDDAVREAGEAAARCVLWTGARPPE